MLFQTYFLFFLCHCFSLKEPLWYLFSIQLHNHRVFILISILLWMIIVVCSVWSELSDIGLLLLVLQCLQCIFYKYDIQQWWSQLDERKLIKSFFTYFVHFRHFGENFLIRKKRKFSFSPRMKTLELFSCSDPYVKLQLLPEKQHKVIFLFLCVLLHHQHDINHQTSWQWPPRWRREWWDERCTRSTTRTSPSMGFTSTNSRSTHVYFSQSLVTTRKGFRYPGIYFWKKFPSFQSNPFT